MASSNPWSESVKSNQSNEMGFFWNTIFNANFPTGDNKICGLYQNYQPENVWEKEGDFIKHVILSVNVNE